MRIYIAGPYTADSQEDILANVREAIDAGIVLVQKGHTPFIPHLTHFVDQRAKEIGIHLTWNDYVSWDLEWLRLCDAILYLGSSKGADLELIEANKLGMRVFSSVAEIEGNEVSFRKAF